ncbi:MAG: dephospho-CoA kinase [Myxococcales bacterium]|nr:dephospho-CoA kinase [Myxococcales bacterium]
MLIGLTGGIACGKTTVGEMLRARGARRVDADAIAREVVEPGTEGLAAIVAAFGPGVLTADGRLDRPALGAQVFGDPALRRKLEGILHPLIAIESARRVQGALAEKPPLVVYDAALLIEAGRADHFRPLVVVFAPPEVQLERLMRRDGLSAAEAQARIASQMPVAEKAALADHVIDNSGTLAATEAQVDALWARLLGGKNG